MAIKVIKHGTKVFRVVCPICGCEFEYEYEDLKTEYGFVRQVKCPDCGNFVTHQDFTPQQPHIPTYPITPTFPGTTPWDPTYPTYPSWPTYPNYPKVTWTTNPGYVNLDCDKCLNRPDPDKPVVGDTPCTWCKKMQPYCTTTTTINSNNQNFDFNNLHTCTSYANVNPPKEEKKLDLEFAPEDIDLPE